MLRVYPTGPVTPKGIQRVLKMTCLLVFIVFIVDIATENSQILVPDLFLQTTLYLIHPDALKSIRLSNEAAF